MENVKHSFTLRNCGVCVAVLVALPLTGCGLVDSDTAKIATERFVNWQEVRKAEEATKQEFARAEQEKARAEANIVISTDAQMAMYALHKANMALREVAIAATGHGPYDGMVSTTPMPKGAFTEFADSLFNGITNVFMTPTAGIVAGGYMVKEVISEANAGAGHTFNTNGGDLTSSDSFNNSDLNQISTTQSNMTQQPYAVKPEVVEPTVITTPAQ